MWKRIISVIGATLAACIVVPAGAASGYDDIINKVSTKTLIHHIQAKEILFRRPQRPPSGGRKFRARYVVAKGCVRGCL